MKVPADEGRAVAYAAQFQCKPYQILCFTRRRRDDFRITTYASVMRAAKEGFFISDKVFHIYVGLSLMPFGAAKRFQPRFQLRCRETRIGS